jgi:hypothetical protein
MNDFHQENEHDNNYPGNGNKIRRGPGRRIAKERRKRYMDQAVVDKYLALTDDQKVEVNAVIETLYRQTIQNQLEDNTSSDIQENF